jgi:hypothetical protein
MGCWFERLMIRFDRIDEHLEVMAMKEKVLEGEQLMDNQDVCQMLNISKRTLQRYRSSGELPYRMLYHKTFYKQSDVEAFIKSHFNKGGNNGVETVHNPGEGGIAPAPAPAPEDMVN